MFPPLSRPKRKNNKEKKDKTDFKTMAILRDKEGLYIMIKG